VRILSIPDHAGAIEIIAEDVTTPAFAILREAEEGRAFPRDLSLFYVDRCVPRCYKPQKDKLFGGESPNELPSAVRE
jgi:hypothetical protein